MRFEQYLRAIQAKEHVYPPMELYAPLEPEQVAAAWRELFEASPPGPIGAYVHIPFCERKCAFCYCDTIISEPDAYHRYLKALLAEARWIAPALGGQPLDTLYLGGGTPTVLSVAQLERLVTELDRLFGRRDGAQLNIEATPASITADKARLLVALGTSRVTLGIQSADRELSASLRRAQSFDQIAAAFGHLRDAGVPYLNLDLIGGLPGDDPDRFIAGLDRLLTLRPDMVHIYPMSPAGGLQPSPHTEAIVRAAEMRLREADLRPLRNDGFGRDPDSRNLQVIDKIEHGGSTLGLGIRARSHIHARLAYRSTSYRDYLAATADSRPPPYLGRVIDTRIELQKHLMDNLKQGLDPQRFRQIFGLPLSAVLNKLAPTVLPLLERDGDGRYRLSEPYRRGHAANPLFFDKGYRAELYSRAIGQPQGWPAERVTAEAAARQPEPDLDYLRFLAVELTRSNVYPPALTIEPLAEAQIQSCWRDLADDIAAGRALDKCGIYIHVPFCVQRCSFCYCYTSAARGDEQLHAYATAVMDQLLRMRECAAGLRFGSAYFGGGTPSLLATTDLAALLTTLRNSFHFHDGFQLNFEATPLTLTDGRLEVLLEHGITRLTMGLQSLDAEVLERIGRPQPTVAHIERLLTEARSGGLHSLNIDLVAGLPGQSYASFARDLDTVLGWRPEVLHVYPWSNTSETIEHRRGHRMSEQAATERSRMMSRYHERLSAAGYQEVPNETYCLSPEHRNIQETDKIDYLSSVMAFGYQARSHVFARASYGSVPEKYQRFMRDRSAVELYQGQLLSITDDMEKFIIANLRRGISRIRFYDLFGEDVLERYFWQFHWLRQRGLVDIGRTTLRSHIDSSQDHLVYAKLFFAERYLHALRERYRDRYRPGEDHRAALERSIDGRF